MEVIDAAKFSPSFVPCVVSAYKQTGSGGEMRGGSPDRGVPRETTTETAPEPASLELGQVSFRRPKQTRGIGDIGITPRRIVVVRGLVYKTIRKRGVVIREAETVEVPEENFLDRFVIKRVPGRL